MNDTEHLLLGIPLEIVNAAIKVEHWFKQQGIEKWALMGIQSREDVPSRQLPLRDQPLK